MQEIKEYKYKLLSKRKLKKDNYVLSEELKDLPQRQELNTKMQQTLSANGLIFLLTKRGIVNGIIFIDKIEVNPLEYGIDYISGEGTKTYAYETREFYLNDDLKNRQDIMMQDLTKQIKEIVFQTEADVHVIKCDNHVIVEKSKRIKNLFPTCIVIGMLAGALASFIPAFENSFLAIDAGTGLVIGLIVALLIRQKTDSWE
ncbi:MAG: hypothetical protein K6G01_05190 [Eubacterium sp.]|nr:hypothetical protein [Eubacterium sp.]